MNESQLCSNERRNLAMAEGDVGARAQYGGVCTSRVGKIDAPMSEHIRMRFSYCPETGVIKGVRGRPVGSPNQGYLYVFVGAPYRTKYILAHRMAWFLHTGEWPAGMIDHINGIRTDNRFANLRPADWALNARNRHDVPTNKNGFRGVEKFRDKYIARIKAGGKARYLGVFETAQLAHEAYLKAKRILHPGCSAQAGDAC